MSYSTINSGTDFYTTYDALDEGWLGFSAFGEWVWDMLMSDPMLGQPLAFDVSAKDTPWWLI